MDKTLLRKRVRGIAARLGILRPLRKLVFRMRGGDNGIDERVFLRRFIGPDSLVFDVGANRGQSSELYIDLGARVVAFEPQTDLHPEIRQLCRNSPQLKIEPCGLGSQEETRRFFITSYDQVASLRDDWEGTRIGETIIQVSTLDLQIQRHGLPSYCKIDVEGWELEVLQGLNEPIPLISFEYHNSPPEIEKAKAVLSRIGSLGSYFCNIKEPSSQDFLLEKFIPLAEFAERFPGGLSPVLSNGYGDVFCVINAELILPFQP
jgi:FkbM family methyltransferase